MEFIISAHSFILYFLFILIIVLFYVQPHERIRAVAGKKGIETFS